MMKIGSCHQGMKDLVEEGQFNVWKSFASIYFENRLPRKMGKAVLRLFKTAADKTIGVACPDSFKGW